MIHTAAILQQALSLSRPPVRADAMFYVEQKWPALLPLLYSKFGPLPEADTRSSKK